MKRRPARKDSEESDGLRVPIVEAAVGILVAVLIEFINIAFFEGSIVGHVFAVAVAVGGLLLAVQRHAIERALRAGLRPLKAIAALIDVGRKADYDPLRGVVQTYSSITEEEFRPVKERILQNATLQLRRLANEKRSIRLSTIDYYSWIFRELERRPKGTYVRMITLASHEEWTNSPLERNFFDAYSLAAESVEVVTIFVVAEDHLEALLRQPSVDAHTVESSNPLVGWWVSLEEITSRSPDMLTEIGGGFMDFGGHVGLEDLPEPSGALRGEVTMHQADLNRMDTLFENLKHLGSRLTRAGEI
ncbi:MAG: hypothetical protein ABI435_02520 [Pseudolysinimonas sp.]